MSYFIIPAGEMNTRVQHANFVNFPVLLDVGTEFVSSLIFDFPLGRRFRI